MSEDPRQKLDHVRQLVVGGVHAAQVMNDQIFNLPEFRKWPPEIMAVASVCLASGFCRGIDLPKDDFMILCSTAFDMVRAEDKVPT